jgi:hypothetical protein
VVCTREGAQVYDRDNNGAQIGFVIAIADDQRRAEPRADQHVGLVAEQDGERIAYLDEGDWVVCTREGAQVYDRDNNPVDRPVTSP